MSAFFARLWTFAKPIVTNPGTWAALISIAAALFGAPGVGLLAPTPTVTMPQALNVKPMALVPIPVKHSGKGLDLDHNSPDGQIFGPMPDGSYLGQFPTPQTVHLFAHSARGGKMGHGHTVITVGDAPNPPGPTPPGPVPPVDPFVQALQNAYNAETDPQKAAHVQFLAGIYKAFAASVVSDQTLNTLADLFAKMHAAIDAPGVGLAATDLANVRKFIGSDLSGVLGTTANAPLDATLRQKASSEFSKLAQALGEVH